MISYLEKRVPAKTAKIADRANTKKIQNNHAVRAAAQG